MSRTERLYPERPVVGCLAVVRRGERVLLAERSVPPGIGKWGFPGGMQELGETIHACAQRELLEETGIRAEPVATLTTLDAIRNDDEGRVKAHYALVCVLLEWRSGEGLPIEDAHRVGWFTLAEALKLDAFPNAVPVMRLALAAGTGPGGRSA